MSRLTFDMMPEEYARARRVIDAAFRSVNEVLDRGFRMREQVRGVVNLVIDTTILPLVIDVKLKGPPLGVLLLSAMPSRTDTGKALSGGVVTWEYRSGRLILHSLSALTAATRYDAVIAVME